MWRFKSLTPKEPTGLEGRFLDVGNLKIQVRNAIAEGGFSCVYLARDTVNAAKQYALKHIICNDEESLELAMKEINVMKLLKGHPNIVTLCAHGILDMGRTKEALVVMEFCDKSLVSVLESRGAGYFEEKQALSIFRDACNAVFAMHSLSPPIAHRDLKAENLLLGPDGVWKLCDFGSTSTNHKRFEKPEEMGIEEDNIRKYTTPAYRAPEMWDLLRRDLINEKVDIWALGCLLFRICYFKNAFDGESKLQILNGNYRIPDLPKYSKAVTDLIRDMLQASPDDRPDITQVWFRVNEQLPANLQKSLPELPPEAGSTGSSRPAIRSHPTPNRSPPPLPSSSSGGSGGKLGAFWSSQHAKDPFIVEDKSKPKHDERLSAPRQDKSFSHAEDKNSKDIEINFFQKNVDSGMEKQKASEFESSSLFQDEGFNSFVAEFDTNKLNTQVNKKSAKEEELEAEIGRLKDQLKQVKLEKTEITSKYEKLSAICRSQRQEIQELRQAKIAKTPSPNNRKSQPSKNNQQGGSDWSNSSPEPKSWQAFTDDPIPQQQTPAWGNGPKKQAELESWGFGADSFTAVSAASSHTSRPINEANRSPQMDKQPPTQPAGWAGF